MRALVCNAYGPPNSLVIEERDDPAPGDGQILVDVKAAGINFPDVLAIAGKYQVKTPTPFVPGNEAAGVVSATGPGVTQFVVGDSVIINTMGGAFAEKCLADIHRCAPLPDKLDFEQGAGFSVTYGTSYHALKQGADLQPGETVLVLGAAGGVGIAAVEIASSMGATVIAAASSKEKLDFAVSAGADLAINYSELPLKDAVREMTGGKGCDVVYDPVGGDLAEQAFRATAWHGRYLVIGFASGDIPKFPANIALLKEASIVGVWWGTWAAKNPALQIQNMRELGELIKNGVLTPRVTESYVLDDFEYAFQAITERRALGKVILRMT
ncbi:MAG: NADPH:quinone oxidoreductase family protein [Gammaproteobacteria bacterium]|nr:NADPH:quinone oxidoreductase family protein [Gammaproteobacteria bacterium]